MVIAYGVRALLRALRAARPQHNGLANSDRLQQRFWRAACNALTQAAAVLGWPVDLPWVGVSVRYFLPAGFTVGTTTVVR